VVIKVSGLHATTTDGRPVPAPGHDSRDVRQERTFFGTNWLVDWLHSYGRARRYAEIISGFSRDEQVAMVSGNAERIFRI
jgi:predicted TIM-barrel fold metal-dependent hydrolase